MTTPIISVKNLGKRYRLGATLRHDTLRDHVTHSFRSLANLFRGHVTPSTSESNARPAEIWALKEVSFEVMPGEVIGVIGRNGAGKSTLLKILSQITEPTTGEVRLRGRTASLLEVGTGFHPELTGRENIFLNGAILGMSQSEIRVRFDEITAFADIDAFLDTPVKRYSSGMYTRLAFAVAAHLQPEILVVDEVLAVGDVQFQKKCLNKMGEVATYGRTIFFVSHNLGAIARLCGRVLLFEQGRLCTDGRPADVIKHYHNNHVVAAAEWGVSGSPTSARDLAFEFVRLKSASGKIGALFNADEPVTIQLGYRVLRPLPRCQIGMQILNSEGTVVFTTADGDTARLPALPREAGRFETTLTIPADFLVPGLYTLLVAAHDPRRMLYDKVDQRVGFEITSSGSLSSLDGRHGVMSPILHWDSRRIGSA